MTENIIGHSFLKLAIDTATSSPYKKKVGAVLMRKNKVITTATNVYDKTHPLQARLACKVGLPEKIYLHAEIAALIKCREEVDTIIVARVNAQGKLRMAKPCKICALALQQSQIDKVFYTTNEGFLYEYSS